MEADDDHVRQGTDQVDLSLQLGAVDTDAHAVEPEEGELDAANISNLVKAQSRHANPVLREQDLSLVGARRSEIREVVISQVGDVDAGEVEAFDRTRVA